MTDDTNPSVVKDDSGDNYGGINTGGSMAQAQTQYLDNLQKLAMNQPPKPLPESSYAPGESQGIERGTMSAPMIGSQPLFAASNQIPFGMMDDMRSSQAQAEFEYYKGLKTYMDKPLIDAKLKLANPIAQPAFASKIQQVTDTMLQGYANRFHGDYVKAYIALQQDPEFNKFLDSVSQYKDMYDSVYKTALDTVGKMADPTQNYTSPEERASVNKFLTSQDVFTKDPSMSFNQLAKDTLEFQTSASIYKIADAATAHIKENVVESLPKLYATMSNDKVSEYVSKTITGDKGQADKIYQNAVAANNLQDDPVRCAQLKTQIEGQIKYGETQTLHAVEQANASRTADLKKLGVDMDDDGTIHFGTTIVPGTSNIGTQAISFHAEKPTPLSSGVSGYTKIGNAWRHVSTDQAMPSTVQSECNINDNPSMLPGRYDIVNVNAEQTTAYQQQQYRNISGVPIPVGTAKGEKQVQEATLTDLDTGQQYKMMGNQTLIVDNKYLKSNIQADYPGMSYVYNQLDKQAEDRKNYSDVGRGSSSDKPIMLQDGADMSSIKDDNTWYTYHGKTNMGSVWHEHYRNSLQENKK